MVVEEEDPGGRLIPGVCFVVSFVVDVFSLFHCFKRSAVELTAVDDFMMVEMEGN